MSSDICRVTVGLLNEAGIVSDELLGKFAYLVPAEPPMPPAGYSLGVHKVSYTDPEDYLVYFRQAWLPARAVRHQQDLFCAIPAGLPWTKDTTPEMPFRLFVRKATGRQYIGVVYTACDSGVQYWDERGSPGSISYERLSSPEFFWSDTYGNQGYPCRRHCPLHGSPVTFETVQDLISWSREKRIIVIQRGGLVETLCGLHYSTVLAMLLEGCVDVIPYFDINRAHPSDLIRVLSNKPWLWTRFDKKCQTVIRAVISSSTEE